jgi:hypothetical protein
MTATRRAALGLGAALMVAVALVSFGRRTSAPAGAPGAPRADSLWYHASDVALLATTGRPQLVEFFHPD